MKHQFRIDMHLHCLVNNTDEILKAELNLNEDQIKSLKDSKLYNFIFLWSIQINPI